MQAIQVVIDELVNIQSELQLKAKGFDSEDSSQASSVKQLTQDWGQIAINLIREKLFVPNGLKEIHEIKTRSRSKSQGKDQAPKNSKTIET